MPGGSLPTPVERRCTYGIACDYEVVSYHFKQHLIEIERGLRVAERLMKGA
jgi:hypothetical protein